MRPTRLVLILIFVDLMLLGGVQVAGLASRAMASEKLGSLTVDEVAAKLGQKNNYVFDNNSKDRWTRGHVPGARWVDPGTVSLSDLPADKTATLIFYCANEH